MKFLKHIRSRSKVQDGQPGARVYDQYSGPRGGTDYISRLPAPVLRSIFAEVCPHALDNSYDSCEESMTEGGCMLCDMRDLAQCALVSKRWHGTAQELLYAASTSPPVSVLADYISFPGTRMFG